MKSVALSKRQALLEHGMKIEPSRDPEHFWHVWPMPKGLSRDDAISHFIKYVKPRNYTFERFSYWQDRGLARTL